MKGGKLILFLLTLTLLVLTSCSNNREGVQKCKEQFEEASNRDVECKNPSKAHSLKCPHGVFTYGGTGCKVDVDYLKEKGWKDLDKVNKTVNPKVKKAKEILRNS